MKQRASSSTLVVTSPAYAVGSAEALITLAETSMINLLGTRRPPWLLMTTDPQKTHVYFLPVTHTGRKVVAIPVIYQEDQFTLDLCEPFEKLNRLVPAGMRDTFEWQATMNPVEIGEATGRALYIMLNRAQREVIAAGTNEKRAPGA
ncbi:MAG: hypothetical protein ACM3XM_16585 [Mycobacterium leprae]